MERAKHLKYKKILRAMVLMGGGSHCGRYDKFSWSRRGY